MTNEATQTTLAIEPTTLTVEALLQMSPEALVAHYGGKKSVTIRSLAALGMTRSQIAKALNIRYQHVRNTLVEPMAAKK